MAPRRHSIGLVAVLFGLLPTLLIASCVVEATAPRSPDVVTGDGAITVASFDFPESVLLAEIYAQAMEAKSFWVKRAVNLGPRELVEPALERGLVEFVPEYVGTAVQFLGRGSGHASADLEATREQAIQAFAGKGIDVLASAPAQDANALAVTAQTAARFKLKTISDLVPVAPRFVLGGPAECPNRPLCLPGLENTYRLKFKEFRALDPSGPVTAAELAIGQIQVAVLFTTDGDIPARGFIVLEDDRRLQPAENVTPVVRRDVVARYGPRFTGAVDAVSAHLTTQALRELNRRLSIGSTTPAQLAQAWLRAEGLLEG